MSIIESSKKSNKDNKDDDTSLWHLRDRISDVIDQSTGGTGWIYLKDRSIIDTIVRTYGDALNRKILNACASRPRNMMEIIAVTKIPQTTCYRKITSLMRDNFLFVHHMVPRRGGKQIIRYMSSFKEIQFHVSEKRELVRVKFQETFLQK